MLDFQLVDRRRTTVRPDRQENRPLLLRAEADGALDWSATPASVRIMSAALLNSRGIRLPGECKDDGFVATAAAILRRTPARSALQDLALSEKRVLLHCPGLLPRPRALSRNLLAEACGGWRLYASLPRWQ